MKHTKRRLIRAAAKQTGFPVGLATILHKLKREKSK